MNVEDSEQDFLADEARLTGGIGLNKQMGKQIPTVQAEVDNEAFSFGDKEQNIKEIGVVSDNPATVTSEVWTSNSIPSYGNISISPIGAVSSVLDMSKKKDLLVIKDIKLDMPSISLIKSLVDTTDVDKTEIFELVVSKISDDIVINKLKEQIRIALNDLI